VQLWLLVTLLSLVPGLAVMITCFPFIVTVLSILRQAIGLQAAPPNMLIVTLALFLTWLSWTRCSPPHGAGIGPFSTGRCRAGRGVSAAMVPFRGSWPPGWTRHLCRTCGTAPRLRRRWRPVPMPAVAAGPAFLLSEIERAFQIGFLIFLPFLVIDLVVAAVLMSMGMMMVPPAIVSLPFKLAFFVVADGWA
jgi:flagellar biosynthesis protein FliP